MTIRRRTVVGVGLGLLVVVGVVLWWGRGPSQNVIRRTVVTTVQDEAPASFLVTGTLDIHVTTTVDSSAYLTPDWLTAVLGATQPSTLSLLRGRSQARVRVPGRASYGFDVRRLDASMIHLSDGNVVEIELPDLSVHSVEPDLSRLEVDAQNEGWVRVFPSTLRAEVRASALSVVESAFREQTRRRINSATQPRLNTARAMEAMLRAPLQAAGLRSPQFRIRIGERLVLQPEAGEKPGENTTTNGFRYN